jgi:hypothetical protein
MGRFGKSKWPPNAEHRLEVRATPEQYQKWHAAACAAGCYDVEVWLARAADFAAWWRKREGDLLTQLQAQLDAEAREHGENLMEAPACPEEA